MIKAYQDAERLARLLDAVSGLAFYAEESDAGGWVVRGVTALADDVVLIYEGVAFVDGPAVEQHTRTEVWEGPPA